MGLYGKKISGFIHRSFSESGPKGTRTPDLPHAMGTRYQLRYGPLMSAILTKIPHHRYWFLIFHLCYHNLL